MKETDMPTGAALTLRERDRQLCPEPIGAPCSCTVMQREGRNG